MALKSLRFWSVPMLLASMLWTAASTAQEDRDGTEQVPTIVITGPGGRLIPLAFPRENLAAELSGETLDAAQEVGQTLRNDLVESRIFNLKGPAELSVLSLTGERRHDFEQYRSLGNEVLLLVDLKRDGRRIVLEGRLFDLASGGQSIAGKLYRGEPSQARQLAHYLADDIYRIFTGRWGISRTRIAFQSDRTGFRELYMMDYDGHGQVQLTGHQSTSGFPSWSSDNREIAYMSYYNGNRALYSVDMASYKKQALWNGETGSSSPALSPDGRRLAFAMSTPGESNTDIYVCNRPCRRPKRLTTSKAIDTNPAWSPNSAQLAFTSSRSGSPQIYVMNADGSGVRRVSDQGSYNEGASWRPDGNQIVYASRRNGRFQIAVTDLVSLQSRVLTAAGRGESFEEPTFAPDGRRIAFTLQRSGTSQIYVMDADGGNLRQLTHEGKCSAPAWSGPPAN